MKKIGAHVSASGGVQNAPLNAAKIGADAFALFVKNQRQWSAKPLANEDIEAFKLNLKISNINTKHILPHNSYLINLGHPETQQRQKSIDAFLDEIERLGALGLEMINFHPGSHLNLISEIQCLQNIANSINYILEHSQNITLVIENTAGQGSNMGYKFEHLAYLIKNTADKNRIGVCIDTCHLFAAGYDIKDKQSYAKTMGEFENLIGFEYLKGMHINDSKCDLGSKKDRHESLGKGYLGWSSFENIMNDDRIDEIPLILETIDDSIWKDEIEHLRNLIKGYR
ncbi:deoxyribonuclease IV [Campylobacter hyointestinalis]|uniref:deoxyribonuclease IV n=1 Tax=Campylobacter hyointestinalis TaxID=198 RepID=UPI000DCCF1E2|nr:deoxyribonuclease IV [Campylobacter hyointestinalis]RAZ46524.1 deoxyribonuclease IV [Campylobacter hyointestinalis subsp. lawsonii]